MPFHDYTKTDFGYIATLPHNMLPQWGSMTLQHMIEHLTDTFSICNGTAKVEVSTPPDKVERLRNIGLYSDREFQQNFKSPILPPNPVPYRSAGMASAINHLIAEIEKFKEYHRRRRGITENHPVFGALDYNGWVIYHNKHFTHHLKQFGLL